MQNTKQIIVLAGISLILMMSIYPPWVYVDDNKVEHSMGYAPIWKPPVASQNDTAELFGIKLRVDLQTQTANAIDFARLLIQITIVSIVVSGAVTLLRRAPV